MDKTNEKYQEENIVKAAIAGSSAEYVQRYGAAAKEHFVAYSGKDNEIGKKLVKGLKDISEEKINPDYQYQNIHQQAGFSAEVKEVANTNAENIIKGSKIRKIRTDDLGRVNDQLFDHVTLDAEGNIMAGSGAQMKFIGASSNDPTGQGAPMRALNKLESKKFEKYLEHDAKIEVPSDYYDKMLAAAEEKSSKLNKQLEKTISQGNTEQADKISRQIDNLNKIKKNLRKSSVSSDEAVFARLHPKLSTAKSVAKISHGAGIQTAQNAAVYGGSVSIVKNLVLVMKGEKDSQEAISSIAKDTLSSAALGYGTGFAGAAIKGAMQNASSESVRALAKTNLAGTIVVVGTVVAKTLKSYFDGEIDGVQCFEELGEQGTGMVSSALFATIGQVSIPIPVVGGLIGGMVGYAISSASYGLLLNSLKDAKMAHDKRIEIEKICEEHIELIRAYRAEMEYTINEYLTTYMQDFHDAFSMLKESLLIGDVDSGIMGANKITQSLGKEVQYTNFKEFNDIMESNVKFRL